jgi:hypothetical protein
MTRIAEQADPVTGGAGTHADVHVAAMAGRVGRVLGTLAWMRAQGELAGAGAGAPAVTAPGLARYLAGVASRWPG